MRKLFFIFLLSFFLPSLEASDIKVITIDNHIISPVTVEYITKGLKEAEKDKAILIIKLDTPGGLLSSTQEIVKLLLNSPVTTITYITPSSAKAASAGVFISYASHLLAMSPATHIGSAHPIIGGGSWGELSPEVKKKILNDTLAWAENIAQQRGRPVKFIKDAVKESISITEKEALKRKVCDLIAADFEDLLKKIDNKIISTDAGEIKISTQNSKITYINLTKRGEFLNALINPNIAYLLLTLGFLGLIFEVTHPGFGFPGIAGLICLILSFYALSILPVNYAGVAFIILGIIFFVVEAFTPTFGMFTLGGIISLTLGSVMLFNQPGIIKVSFMTILPVVLFFSVLSLFFIAKTVAAVRRKSTTGADGLLGKTGIARTDILNTGKVFIHGEIWDAASGGKIQKGDEVIVEKVSGLKLIVKKKEEK